MAPYFASCHNNDALVKTGTTSQVPLMSVMQEPLVSDSMGTMEVGSTPIAEKISKIEELLIDGSYSCG
jgi:hypothetical protein